MSKEFLENLKVDDKVGIRTVYHGLRLDRVLRITKTLIIVGNTRFNKARGVTLGDGWNKDYLVEATDEFIKEFYVEYQIKQIKKYIDNGILKKLNETELKDIYLKLKEIHNLKG